MVKKNPSKIRHNFNRTFTKPKEQYAKRYWRQTEPMTDEYIQEIRERFKITPKDPKDLHGFPHAYQKGM